MKIRFARNGPARKLNARKLSEVKYTLTRIQNVAGFFIAKRGRYYNASILLQNAAVITKQVIITKCCITDATRRN